MNTRKFSGDMADQVEKDRDQLIEMKEVLSWASNHVHLCKCAFDGVGNEWKWAIAWDCNHWTCKPTLYEALHTAWEKRDE